MYLKHTFKLTLQDRLIFIHDFISRNLLFSDVNMVTGSVDWKLQSSVEELTGNKEQYTTVLSVEKI